MNRLERFVDRVTRLPGALSEKADELNDKLIKYGRDIERAAARSGDTASRNLTQNKIQSLGRDAAEWLSNPSNLGIIGGVLILIFILRK